MLFLYMIIILLHCQYVAGEHVTAYTDPEENDSQCWLEGLDWFGVKGHEFCDFRTLEFCATES